MVPDRFSRCVVLLIPLVAAGCLQTSYRPLQPTDVKAAERESAFERRVDYRLTDAFYSTGPACAAVRTMAVPAGRESRGIVRLVEEAVERHLAMRLPRVVGAARLRRAETRLGINMTAAAGRRVFSRQARCDALVDIRLSRVRDDYMVLFAQRSLTIGLTMRRMSDGKILWQARHSAGRADGGLPISIIDLPLSAARAGMMTNDPEMFASIADDAVRRMFKTLPDVRGLDTARGLFARH